VNAQPGTQSFERLYLQWVDRPVGTRSHVQEQVPILADDIHQQTDQITCVLVIAGILELVVSERIADAPAGFPLMRRDVVEGSVFGCDEIVVPWSGWITRVYVLEYFG
jgi:hypothetical protein